MHRGRGFAAAALVAVLTTAGSARGEESDHDRAVAAFAEARKLIDAGDCSGAIPKLEESIAREASVGARFSLADCMHDPDPYGAFWQLREAALLAFVKHDDRLAQAESRAAAIVAVTGGLRFDVDGTALRAPGFDLRVDDRPIDRFHFATPIAIATGDHRIVATVADGRRYEGTARVTWGSITHARVVLVHPPAVVASPPRPPVTPRIPPRADDDSGMSGRRKLALGVGGAGIAALTVATAFGIVALEKRSELDRACNGDRNACTGDPRVVDPVVDSGDANATISTVLFVVGGALLAGGAALWLTDSKSTPKNAAVLRW